MVRRAAWKIHLAGGSSPIDSVAGAAGAGNEATISQVPSLRRQESQFIESGSMPKAWIRWSTIPPKVAGSSPKAERYPS